MGSAIKLELEDDCLELKRDSKIREKVQTLSGIDSRKQILFMACDWFAILTAVALSQMYFSVFGYLLSIVVIAGLQHALAVLVHDAAHFRLHKSLEWNDRIANWFGAYPVLFDVKMYRQHHLHHHRYLNTDQDPDWARKIHLAEWQYPQAKRKIWKTFGKQILIGGYEWTLLAAKMAGLSKAFSRGDISEKKQFVLRVSYWIVVAALLSAVGQLSALFFYWFVPLLVIFPLLQRIRSVSEHFGLPNKIDLNSARNTLASPLECFFLAPHSINYHLIHHLFPSIPHYNLAVMHDYLVEYSEFYRANAHLNFSFLAPSIKSVLSDLSKLE